MSVERLAFEGWEEVQRQSQDIADRLASLSHGLGCMLQSHVRLSGLPSLPFFYPPELAFDRPWYEDTVMSLSAWSWPWPWALQSNRRSKARFNRVQFNGIHKSLLYSDKNATEEHVCSGDGSAGVQDLTHRLGQAGSALGNCINSCIRETVNHLSWTLHGMSIPGALSGFFQPQSTKPVEYCSGMATMDEIQSKSVFPLNQDSKDFYPTVKIEDESDDIGDFDEDFEDASNASNEELISVLNNQQQCLHRQPRSINVTAAFDSQTRETETSFVARGDLWRIEASHGNGTSVRRSPLFLVQVGPILLVRDTTLLLPVHISKQHLLWYGFDRKNGVHSLCPAVWSKHRRWLLMSMICLNPFTCSFLDFQSPNGQFTYVAGEGLSTGAYFPLFGGIFQAQGSYPGDMKVSFSKKVGWGTRITPVLHFPDRSISLDVVQQLAWKRSGAMVRPMFEVSLTPTLGGRNAGWRAELMHFPKEKLSLACGFAMTVQPTVFTSLMVGKSKRNGKRLGNSGVELQAEAPMDNLRRASISIRVSSGVEF